MLMVRVLQRQVGGCKKKKKNGQNLKDALKNDER